MDKHLTNVMFLDEKLINFTHRIRMLKAFSGEYIELLINDEYDSKRNHFRHRSKG